MLKELFEAVQQAALAARQPTITPLPGHERAYIRSDAHGDRVDEAPPPPTDLTVVRLPDFIDVVKSGKYGSTGVISVDADGAVWHTNHLDPTANARVRMHLPISFEWGWFSSRVNVSRAVIAGKELYDLLRTQLSQTMYDAELIRRVANLVVRRETTTTEQHARARESISRAITDEVQEPESLPDEDQGFYLRMWDSPDVDARQRVQCLVRVDLASQQWIVWTRPESFVAAAHAHIATLVGHIRTDLDGLDDILVTSGTENTVDPEARMRSIHAVQQDPDDGSSSSYGIRA